ncbi:TetR/AcrR family transcriptional regulator [Pseudalkalibacillus hwajinpoensis]|uniref:TetR/AcrR family transcriptional regulator n=1 Tax=Guptibacillus hwajinpoensis TaxID=208199 RepID=UPI00325BEE42
MMNEKKKLIIEAAMHLFAKKGFHSTSIQEIANESGISKGAVYLHFQSKDDVLYSIFAYHYEKLKANISEAKLDSITPEERLKKLLYVQGQEILQHKEFIIMQFREQAISMNKEIDELIMKIRIESLQTLATVIKDLYGDKVTPILPDCVLLLDGMYASYIKLMVLEDVEIDLEKLPLFIMDRMNNVVEGLIRDRVEPLLSQEKAYSIFKKKSPKSTCESSPLSILIEMESTVKPLNLQVTRKEELIETLHFLMKEARENQPRLFIFKGMLHQFEGISELDLYTKALIEALDLER